MIHWSSGGLKILVAREKGVWGFTYTDCLMFTRANSNCVMFKGRGPQLTLDKVIPWPLHH